MYKKLEDQKLVYWANALGEINIPGKSPTYIGSEEELPSDELRELYRQAGFYHGNGENAYPMTVNGENGLGVTWYFQPWDHSFETLKTVADAMDGMDHAKVYLGKDTDPFGYELLAFYPYDCVSGSEKIRVRMDAYDLYAAIEPTTVYFKMLRYAESISKARGKGMATDIETDPDMPLLISMFKTWEYVNQVTDEEKDSVIRDIATIFGSSVDATRQRLDAIPY